MWHAAAPTPCLGCQAGVGSLEPQPRRGIRLGRITLTRGQLAVVIILLVVLALGATAVAMRLAAAGDGGNGVASTVAVTVATAVRRDLAISTDVAGLLAPEANLNLTCKVAGVVAKVHVSLGDTVTAGQVLLSLASGDIAPQAAAAEAALAAAKAGLLKAQQGATWEDRAQLEAALAQAQAAWEASVTAYERMKYLFDQGAISRQQFEASETQLRVASAQLSSAQAQISRALKGADEAALRAAEAQVRQAQAAYQAAAGALEDTVLRAPVAGVISYVSVSQGQLVSPAVPQVGLVSPKRMYLEAAVTENLLSSLVQGASVPVSIPALNLTRTATIDQIAPAANSSTRLFQVRMALDNADGMLRGGLTAEAKIETAKAQAVLVVPREAVVSAGSDSHYVFVVNEGVARRREVQTGILGDVLAEVTSGLTDGETVVVTGVDFLRDGTAVNVVRDVTP